MSLYEILVPKCDNDGNEFSVGYHNVWDDYVKTLSNGLTVMRSVKGTWINEGKTYEERMIPVRIICSRADIENILGFTLGYYNQIKVLAYKISEEVIIYP